MLYIAGPIAGMPDYRLKFEAASRALVDAGFQVLNPCDLEGGYNWVSWMKVCIPQMLTCEGVALLPGWEYSRGAQIEQALAHELGISVKLVNEWIFPYEPSR